MHGELVRAGGSGKAIGGISHGAFQAALTNLAATSYTGLFKFTSMSQKFF